jgi:hypothetical protein
MVESTTAIHRIQTQEVLHGIARMASMTHSNPIVFQTHLAQAREVGSAGSSLK